MPTNLGEFRRKSLSLDENSDRSGQMRTNRVVKFQGIPSERRLLALTRIDDHHPHPCPGLGVGRWAMPQRFFLLLPAALCCILSLTYPTIPPTGGVSAMMRNLIALLVALLGSSVAFAQRDTDLLPANRPIEQVIDHYIDAKLKEAKVAPAPQADDAALL